MTGGPILLPDGGVQNIQFTFVNDLAESFVLAASTQNAAGRIYNIAQTEITSLRNFLDECARHLGVSPTYVEAPSKWIGLLGGPFAHATPTLLDISRATSELGLRPTPFTDFTKLTSDWFKENPPDENEIRNVLRSRRAEIRLCRFLRMAQPLLTPLFINKNML